MCACKAARLCGRLVIVRGIKRVSEFWLPQNMNLAMVHCNHGALRRRTIRFSGIICAGLFVCALQGAAKEPGKVHQSVVRNGVLPTSDGLTLRVKTDLGSVEIQALPPDAAPQVRYTVNLETDAAGNTGKGLLEAYALATSSNPAGVELTGNLPPHNNQAQFWVQYVISVPANYSVEISTGAGDIQTSDIGGRVLLQTEGGNVTTGRIRFRGIQHAADAPVAKINSQGGHIKVQDVSGDLDAFTAGGHIMVGNIAGNAKLRTGGGHIRAGKIKGTAQLETDGGNITVGEAGAFVAVRTGGGQIDFGEVHGSVHAQTGGGGIRVISVAGPMEVETSGGSICLTRIRNTVRAETGDGTITAWINPESGDRARPARLPGPSQLATGTGDIVVFLPRDIAATIDATVQNGGLQRIEADPSFPLNLQLRADGQAHAMGTLNGGGAILHLRTTTGKIKLQYLDEDLPLRETLLQEQRSRIAQKLNEAGYEEVTVSSQMAIPRSGDAGPGTEESKSEWQSWVSRFEITFLGGMHEDPDEFKKHLLNSPPPDYPQLAKRAGVQGVVRLQVKLKTDGSLSVEKVLEGEPALVEAATAAIQQWRATPEQFGGRKVDVISTVTFNFQLR
jgi:TonB family protein